MAKGKYASTRARRRVSEMDKAYQNTSRSGRKSKRAKRKNRSAGIIAITIALLAVIIGVVAGYFYLNDLDADGIILDNVTVAGVDVGGMTQAEAIDAVRKATSSTYSTSLMVVKVLDSQITIPPNFVGKFDINGAVKAAYKFGNTGSQSKRQEEQNIAMTKGYAVDLTPYLNLNENGIKDLLKKLGANYSSTLSQSTYEVTGTKPNQKLVITLGVPEYGLDLNQLYQQVLDAYSANKFSVEGQCGMIEPNPIDLEAIYNKYTVAPINATFDKKTFEVVEGVEGYGFDLNSVKTKLKAAQYGTTIEIPFATIQPEVTSENLTLMLYRDVLGTYTAEYKSDSDRDTNLRLACEAINGLILYPGEVFSFNSALGERTAARGYKLGPSFSGEKTVMTYGGGICQVSSALYCSTLMAELETLVRKNDVFAASYAPLGMDATVSWGSVDFRFRNSSDYPIRIDAIAEGGTVTVSLVGTDLRDYYIEMETEILNEESYSVTTKNVSAGSGYKNGDYITEPYTGYDVKIHRCKYDKETQELISKEFIAQSTYKKRDGVVAKVSGIGGGSITDDDGKLPD